MADHRRESDHDPSFEQLAPRVDEDGEGLAAEGLEGGADDYLSKPFNPRELLARISTRIINEVKGVNRVCYDISSKPPATIEWE